MCPHTCQSHLCMVRVGNINQPQYSTITNTMHHNTTGTIQQLSDPRIRHLAIFRDAPSANSISVCCSVVAHHVSSGQINTILSSRAPFELDLSCIRLDAIMTPYQHAQNISQVIWSEASFPAAAKSKFNLDLKADTRWGLTFMNDDVNMRVVDVGWSSSNKASSNDSDKEKK